MNNVEPVLPGRLHHEIEPFFFYSRKIITSLIDHVKDRTRDVSITEILKRSL